MAPKNFEAASERQKSMESTEWRTKDPAKMIKVCPTYESLERNPEFSRYKHFPRPAQNVRWNTTASLHFSKIDSSPKVSYDYYCCVGFVLIGENDKGENISLLGHHLAFNVLSPNFTRDKEELEEKIRDFLSEVKPGTVDAGLFAGSYDDDGEPQEGVYESAILSMGKIIQNELGFDPPVLSGPTVQKIRKGPRSANVAFNTKARQLWIVRSHKQDDSLNKPFPASQVKEALKGFPNYTG
ncbi:hypothetical protein HY969_01155 [Candidatus Kaiserbacteria bacterium]|nr:hypothetical protein [Candidatus Kaiserbacteria bacterium]